MKYKICKIVSSFCAKCVIFAVLILLMSACSAKQKVVEKGHRLEMSADSVVTAQHTQAQQMDAQTVIASDSTTLQIRATATIDTADSVLVVRVTDYDSVTGLPLRTIETENRSTLQHTVANADYLQQIARYEQQLLTMQRSFDSLLVSMRHTENLAQRDSTLVHQQSEPSFSAKSLTNLGLLLVIFAMICIACKIFRRS